MEPILLGLNRRLRSEAPDFEKRGLGVCVCVCVCVCLRGCSIQLKCSILLAPRPKF